MASPAAARRNGGAHDVIDLCDDDDTPTPRRRSARRSTQPRAFLPSPPVGTVPAVAAAPPSSGRRRQVVTLFDDGLAGSASSQPGKRRRHGKGTQHRKRGKRDPNETPGDSSSDDTSVEVVKTVKAETDQAGIEVVNVKAGMSPQSRVLEVFPDCDLEHIKELLKEHDGNVEVVIAVMAEKSYPKVKIPKTANRNNQMVGMMGNSGAQQQWQYDYENTESFTPTLPYIQQAQAQLQSEFPALSKFGSSKILDTFKNHYAVAFDKVLTAIKGTDYKAGEELEEVQYHRVNDAARGKPLDAAQTGRVNALVSSNRKIVLKQPRHSSGAGITEPILLEEIRYVMQKLGEWKGDVKKNIHRRRRKEAAEKSGTGVECLCCFDQYPIEDMVACRNEGHLFCADCLKSYVENQVFGQGNLGIDTETKKPALEIKCFHGDGCTSGFHKACLEKALPTKVMRKYDELQAKVTLDSAGLDDVCTCPKCGFQAALDPSVRVFSCPVEGCLYDSCRECGEEAHVPLRCDEVEKDEEKKGRLTVEEAISAAKIRKCPKCSKPFIKSDGCNKMKCGHCGEFSCYICRQKISKTAPYKHFCQTPHCQHGSCGMCPLWTKAGTEDVEEMREAALKAAREASGDANIDVDSILKAGKGP